MPAEMMTYLPLILLGLATLALGLWLVSRSVRKARVIADDSSAPLARDVLAEGAAPAPRNQALIDAAPAAVKPEPAAALAPAPAPAPAAADDLSRIKGIGPKLVALLGELGVTSFAQIAAWNDEDITRVDAQLGRFAGRITRDQWVEQARLLSAGDEAGFAEKFGRNG